MDLYELCSKLEQELSGRRGFINNQVDIARCRIIMSQIMECLPQYMKRADDIVSSKQMILSNADSVAKNVLKEAEDRAAQLVSESEVLRRASAAGSDLIDDAYKQCDSLVLKTKEHLDVLLKETEEFLRLALQTVTTNRFELKNLIINAKK